MGAAKLVSIIVPVYNSISYLDNCLTSILNQTYKDIEVILIDDGSTDGSGSLCDMYMEKDNRIKVIHQENSGPSSARNAGIQAASGEYLQFVDGDDTIDPDMTKTLVASIADGHQLVICGYKNMVKCNNQWVSDEVFRFNKPGSFEKKEFLEMFGELYRDYYIHFNWNKLYITSIIRDHTLQFDGDIIRGEDMLFNLKYLEKCSRIKIIEQAFYNYMTSNNESITSTFRPDLFENQQLLFQRTREFLWRNQAYTPENGELVETFYTTRIVACFSNLFHPKSNMSARQIQKQILIIMWDKCVNEQLRYFMQGNLEKRLIGYLLAYQQADLIYWYFKIRSLIRKILNGINPKSQKWI